MSHLFFYILLIIFNIIEFVFFLSYYRDRNYIIGAFLGFIVPLLTFIALTVTYEILRKKTIINKNLNVSNKKNKWLILSVLLILIIGEVIFFLNN
jgi:hypothetical protein